MGPEGIILVNPPITTLQQSLTHSAVLSGSVAADRRTDGQKCESRAVFCFSRIRNCIEKPLLVLL